jgi:hypothetical protein
MKGRGVVRGSVFCVLAAVIMLGGMAMKAEAGSIRLSMADFTSDGMSATSYNKWFSDGYLEGDNACLVAPIPFKGIPGKLKNVTLYVIDGAGGFWGGFYGVDMTTGAVTDVVEGITSYPSPDVQALVLTPLYPKLNKKNQYYLGICIYSNQYFYGAQVNY